MGKREVEPTFGHLLRAHRLCFGWSGRHKAYIRMTEVEPGRFRIDIASGDRLPSGGSKHELHAIWYDKDGDKPDDLLDACAPLVDLASRGGLKTSQYISYFVGDDGNVLPGQPTEETGRGG